MSSRAGKCLRKRRSDRILSVYVSESFCGQQEAQKLLEGQNYEVVSDAGFKSISDTKTPQGILCLVKMPQYGLSELLQGERTHLLVLEGIQDPWAISARCCAPGKARASRA